MVATWKRNRLGDFVETQKGYAFKSGWYSAAGRPIVKVSDFTDDSIDASGLVCISEEIASDYLKYELKLGEVVVQTVGSWPSNPASVVGKCVRIPSSAVGALLNQNAVKLSPASDLDAQFLFYLLRCDKFKTYIIGTAQGAASQAAITLEAIRAYEFAAPPLPVQRRIAGILSAYDELMEKSQRRIRLLEAMARALYREWFVHFRFPGHEKHPRVASPLGDIPQGWEVKEMREVADVIDCLHSKKPSECPDGPGIFLQLNNIGEGGKLDMGEQFRISADDYARWTSRIELQAGDCVITNVGRVGAVGQVPEGVKAAPGRNMTAIRPRAGRLTPTYLIEYLLSSHMTSEVAKKMDLGTIMDSLNVKGIVRLHVPCPPMEAMLKFESVARPMRKRIEVLVDQIQNLRRTRDLLLPRLLSGQVELKTEAA